MKYENIKIGDKASIKHVITQTDIDKFVDLTGDDNRVHVDKEYASKTSFKKPVVHGMLSASFISTIIGTRIPGDGALWYAQNLEFLLPVRIGDELTIHAEVINKIDRLNAVELNTIIYNQNKQKVINGTAKVKVVGAEEFGEDIGTGKIAPKIALVIGATGGIGSATVKLLADSGYDVAIHYFSNKGKAEALKKEIEKGTNQKATVVTGDIRDKTTAEEIVEYTVNRLGAIDTFINAATIKVPNINFESLEWDDFQQQIDIHIKSFFYLMKCVVPVMEKHKNGKIINITTQAIEYPFPDLSHYIVAKAALQGISKSWALDLAKKGIRINMVSPGITETNLNADLPEKARLLAASRTPLKRLAKPEDVAEAVGFLVSDKAAFITGETIRVNGGQIMF